MYNGVRYVMLACLLACLSACLLAFLNKDGGMEWDGVVAMVGLLES